MHWLAGGERGTPSHEARQSKEKETKGITESKLERKLNKKPEKNPKKLNLEKTSKTSKQQLNLNNSTGAAYAMSSEDMDSLTFGAPRVLRNLMTPASAKLPVQEYDYSKVLSELGLTEDQFVDLCILCGCDYAGTIRGIGPKSALNLIRQHGTIEKVLEHIDRAKYPVPEPFPYEQARKLFKGKNNFFVSFLLSGLSSLALVICRFLFFRRG